MQVSDNGINLIKRFEGCRLRAYLCPAGKLTIGWGWTQAVDGKPIKPGMQIDQATADRLLRCVAVEFEQAVNKLVRVRVNQSQFDALVSLAYNIGTWALSTSTLLKLLNAGDYAGAAGQFLRWNKSGERVIQGLTNRREAERRLFLS